MNVVLAHLKLFKDAVLTGDVAGGKMKPCFPSLDVLRSADLGLGQTSNFSCAEPNANDLNSLFELICIRFGT